MQRSSTSSCARERQPEVRPLPEPDPHAEREAELIVRIPAERRIARDRVQQRPPIVELAERRDVVRERHADADAGLHDRSPRALDRIAVLRMRVRDAAQQLEVRNRAGPVGRREADARGEVDDAERLADVDRPIHRHAAFRDPPHAAGVARRAGQIDVEAERIELAGDLQPLHAAGDLDGGRVEGRLRGGRTSRRRETHRERAPCQDLTRSHHEYTSCARGSARGDPLCPAVRGAVPGSITLARCFPRAVRQAAEQAEASRCNWSPSWI